VGRRGQAARCLLVSADPGPATRERLEMLCAHDDGFALAEADLRLRGPGELFGLRQHGIFHCRFPEVLVDPDLLARARAAAGRRRAGAGRS
jgi:ATP-dependent DNA helicase RecG